MDKPLRFERREFAGSYPAGTTMYIVDKERVLTAAVLLDGVILTMERPARHWNILHTLPEKEQSRAEQGFLTSWGRFVRRKPACIIAEKAGQLNQIRPKTDPQDTLFSEDLW